MKFLRSRTVLFSIINLGIITFLIYYLYIHAEQYRELLQVSITGIAALLVLAATSPILNGLINDSMFQSLGVNLGIKNGIYLAAASTLANELPISGGIIAKGYYLKYKHNLSYTKYFSASLAFFVCIIAVNGGIGIAILTYWALFKDIFSAPFLWIGFGAMTASLLVFLFPVKHRFIPAKLRLWLDQSLEGWLSISQNPQLLLKLIVFQIGLMFVFAIRYWLAFHMLSQNVTFSQSMLFSAATVLTQLVSFAPGGLGVREAIVGSISSALGFSMEGSVAAVGLDRLISIIITVMIGWRSTLVLSKQIAEMRSSVEKKILTS